MWIFDSYYKGCVELWSRERGLNRTSVTYPPSFYMHLKDPSAHWEMIEGLESRIRSKSAASTPSSDPPRATRSTQAEEVAEKIEKQSFYVAELYNVNVSRISGIWPKRTCFPAETETSPGSLPTSRFP